MTNASCTIGFLANKPTPPITAPIAASNKIITPDPFNTFSQFSPTLVAIAQNIPISTPVINKTTPIPAIITPPRSNAS